MVFATACFGKDIKTVVLKTQPEMHCENCEKKIKDNIRFEKGIKSIKTNLDDKTVTIEYDADKTNVQNIIQGFKKNCCGKEKKEGGCKGCAKKEKK